MIARQNSRHGTGVWGQCRWDDLCAITPCVPRLERAFGATWVHRLNRLWSASSFMSAGASLNRDGAGDTHGQWVQHDPPEAEEHDRSQPARGDAE